MEKLKEIFIKKVLKNEKNHHCAEPNTWPLNCRMAAFISNVAYNCWCYCRCQYMGKKILCDICRFHRDLKIFEESEVEIKKPLKITTLRQNIYKFLQILSYWNRIKPEYIDYFDYSKEWMHQCVRY